MTSVEVEDALNSDEVRTIQDFFARLRDTPVKNAHPEYGDLERLERESENFEDYIETFYTGDHHPGVTRAEGLDRMAESMTWWRYPTRQVTETAKVYSLLAHHPTKLQDLANWGVHVSFHVFVDDRGEILGWFNLHDAKGQ